jgi:hypothetical protein
MGLIVDMMQMFPHLVLEVVVRPEKRLAQQGL